MPTKEETRAKLRKFIELCIKQDLIADLQPFADGLEDKHNASIVAAIALDNNRAARNGFYYTDEKSVLNIAKRYKKLVFGAYGGDSDEYKAVNEIPFEKP